MELVDFFRDVRPWGQFWRLLDQLGADSRFNKAQQDDPELAEAIVADEDEDAKWHPQPADWTLLHELTAQVRDRLGDLAALIADLPVGVKQRHKSPPAFPRPETALDKARVAKVKREEQEYDEKIHDFAERAKQRYREQQAALRQEMSDALDNGGQQPEA